MSRRSGDGWVEASDGSKYWGLAGAAGLLLHDPARGVLLQHRVEWSHFGGTWGIPGGARDVGESAVDGALRECREETGVPATGDDVRLICCSVYDREVWSYSTVVAEARRPLEASVMDRESLEVRWVPVDEVETLPLHPGFAASWPALRETLARRLVVLVDAANVVGSRPDGWWKDRAGATERFVDGLRRRDWGLDAEALGLPGTLWWPDEVVVVVEGRARGAWMDDAGAGQDDVGPEGPAATEADDVRTGSHPKPVPLRLVAAPADGDSEILAQARTLLAAPGTPGRPAAAPEPRVVVPYVYAVTADRALRAELAALGARPLPPSTLLT